MSQSSVNLDEEGFVTIDEVGEEEADDSVQLLPDDISTVTVLDSTIDEPSDGEIQSINEDSNSNLNQNKTSPESPEISEKIEENSSTCGSNLAPNESENEKASVPVDMNVTPVNQGPKDKEETKRCLLNIQFSDKKMYLMFQEEFMKVITDKFKKKADDLEIESNIIERHIKVLEKVVKKADGFLIDTTPTQKSGLDSSIEGTPNYKKTFQNIVLSGEKDQKFGDQGLRRSNRPKNICFNCDKDTHVLRDCPEKKNIRKIQKMREEYSKKHERYHEEFENKYGRFIPGQISDKLKDALGLRRNELPLHIYQMRMLGYPPGWLEEAKIQHSGLSLFDSKGKRVLEDDEDEGEIDAPRHKYDVQKLHEFPGFNVVPNHEILEGSFARNFPPMLPCHSKEELIKSLSGNIVDGYKRKKLKNLPTAEDGEAEMNVEENDATVCQEAEMEIEDNDNTDIMPLGVTVINLPSSPEPDVQVVENNSRTQSPTLEELEMQQKKLRAAIGESSVFLDTTSVSQISNLNETIEIDDSVGESSMEANNVTIIDTILENSVNENIENSQKAESVMSEVIQPPLRTEQETSEPPPPGEEPEPEIVEKETSQVAAKPIDLLLGTPVLPSFSPFNTLPSGEAFSKGVCDVIAFENLPDSTGKYDQMRSLISQVRKKVAELHKE